LGRFVRKKLRRWGFKGDFLCVWSDEDGGNFGDGIGVDGDGIYDDVNMDISDNHPFNNDHPSNNNINADINDDHSPDDNINTDINNDHPSNKTINGSLVAVTGVFGFTLSGLVIQDIINKTNLQ
jgi:tRNA A37 threonylcarbamoyladenosine dehydratase